MYIDPTTYINPFFVVLIDFILYILCDFLYRWSCLLQIKAVYLFFFSFPLILMRSNISIFPLWNYAFPLYCFIDRSLSLNTMLSWLLSLYNKTWHWEVLFLPLLWKKNTLALLAHLSFNISIRISCFCLQRLLRCWWVLLKSANQFKKNCHLYCYINLPIHEHGIPLQMFRSL